MSIPKNSDGYIFKKACEGSFSFFARSYLKVLEPETSFEWNWHHDVLCKACEDVHFGVYHNLDINIGPRTLKSIIVSVLFPCWVWTTRPWTKFICGSRSNDLATQFNMKRRDLITSHQYARFWPIPIKDDQNTAKKFSNYEGGLMQAVSAEGKVVGLGADVLLSDDLLDAKEAYSQAKRESVNKWFSEAFFSRVQSRKRSKRININQRLHVNDVSGNIREKHPSFKRLIIPMEKTEKNDSTCLFVDPRQVGEFIQPSRYSYEEKEEDVKALGIAGYSAQYQQAPRPSGGGIIKEEWLRYYHKLPDRFDSKLITGDLNFNEGEKSDFACFQCWGKVGPDKYLIDIIRGRWSYKQTKESFDAFAAKHSVYSKYIENKANGPALISDFKEAHPGLKPWPEKGSPYMKADKIQRLHMVSTEYENGNVYFPNGILLVDQFVEELTGFTDKGSTTGHDDMVDTMTMALIELKKSKSFFEA